MSTDDQTNIDDLREELERKDQRIDELEQQMHEIASAVEQQDKTTPLKDRTGISRRELMGAALGGSVLGLGGAAASQEFSDSAKAAGSPAPDVGTPNDRVDVFGAEIDSNSVSTEEVLINFDPSSDDLQTVVDNAPAGATIRGDLSTVSTQTLVDITTQDLTFEHLNLKVDSSVSESTNDELLKLNATGIIVRRCIIDGNKANLPDNESVSAIGIRANDCQAKGNIISDTDRHGILVKAGESVVRDNIIHTPDRLGVGVEGAVASLSAANCVVDANSVLSPATDGIQVDRGFEHVTVSDNYVDSAGDAGISVTDHNDTPPENVTVRGNKIDNPTNEGIRTDLVGAASISFLDNNISGCRFGISAGVIDDLTVRGNEIQGHSANGIDVATCDGAVVTNNHLHDSASSVIGIRSRNNSDIKINDNRVFGSGTFGVEIKEDNGASHTDQMIEDNLIKNAGDGIRIRTRGGGTIDYYMVVGNNLRNNATPIDDSVNSGNAVKTDNLT